MLRQRVVGDVRFALTLMLVALSALASSNRAVAEDELGAKLYQKQCASCHGAKGEGTADNYPDPLFGDRSLVELTRYIVESMPEGEPELCVGEEAAAVARYMYDAFYSPIAQARLKPARLQLSRLTVRQYANSVADLVTGFRGENRWKKSDGLKAEYYKSRRFGKEDLVISRNDPQVDFSYADGTPAGPREVKPEAPPEAKADEKKDEKAEDKKDEKAEEKKDEKPKEPTFDNPDEFSARWNGSVFAPETGDYEFIVETENGMRLWVNDTSTPLIDAWVKSGNDNRYTASVRLLGGRAYRLRMEFFKFKEKSASIRLKWRAPHHVEEVIPARYLSTDWFPTTFVVTTPFPPDDASSGFERGTSVSREWDEATTFAALETAKYVVVNLSELSRSKPTDGDRKEKVQKFCDKFVERAFRRPLSDTEREFFVNRIFAAESSPEDATLRTVLLALKSPRFLYREFGQGEFDQLDLASWLSFTLWDSIPDQQLFDAATKGQLQDRAAILRQADRMVNDPRAKSKMQEFLHHWLRVDHFPDISKDRTLYPEFDAVVFSDLRTSLDLFVNDVVWSDRSDFHELLTSDVIYLNGRLGALYGVELDKSAEFQPVSLPNQRRSGVLSHPYLMSGFGYDKSSSPIHRGVFLAKSVLGRFIKTPPIAVAPLAPDLHANMTTRERVTLQTSPDACQSCHTMINGLGFSLENFDAVGRYREQEVGRPIDAKGTYFTTAGKEVELDGARGLSEFLASSAEPSHAFVEQLFQFMVKQPAQAFSLDEVEQLHQVFAQQNFNIRKLLAEMATVTALQAQEANAQALQSASN